MFNVEGLVKLLIYDNNVVDVAFKLSIFNLLKVDSEFKLLKMVVDVLFKLVIDNIELVDKLFKLEFIVNTDKLDAFISPTTFNRIDNYDEPINSTEYLSIKQQD